MENKSTKVFSSIQENRVARSLNWGVVTGSGSRAGLPGDILGAHWLGECKTHTEPGHQISFNLNVWRKLQEEAQSKFRFPVLIVDDGSQRLDKTWVLFPFLLVAPYYSQIIDYPFDVRININFKSDELQSYYNDTAREREDSFLIISVKFNDDVLGICPFTEFREHFKD